MTENSRKPSLSVLWGWIVFTFVAGWPVSTALADPLGIGSGRIYRLGPDATFQEGCFPPCKCPIMNEQPLLGTFNVVYTGREAALDAYAVEDVNLFLPSANTAERIVGSGKLSVGTPSPLTVLQQRLELDLRMGDEAVQHFDSGWVPLNQGLIDVMVSINNMFCWDRVLRIQALRVPASEIRQYGLGAGSTFQRGCLDGFCDCAMGPEVPLGGEFALIPLMDNTLFEVFSVVNVRWGIVAADPVERLPIHGVGLYWVGGEVAVKNRLSMVLTLAADAPTWFDSGMVGGDAGFPDIDILTRTHTQCLDTFLHVVASPRDGGETCGGIAGIPCDAGEYCSIPPGHCCCDFQGVCQPIPDACPEYYDPVCGCDGVTYSNPCFAAAAAMSVDYFGPCERCCGGWCDYYCKDGEFCKFSYGFCNDWSDASGVCTPIPSACPDVWIPVCGCNGLTYGNECEADAARVSVVFHNACVQAPCSASRFLMDPTGSYCGPTPRAVHIRLSPPNGAVALALEDSPPVGSILSDISDGGVYDAARRKVKWGPFFPPFPSLVSYHVISSTDPAGSHCFTGTVSFDGVNASICGDDCLDPCCPLMAADTPHGGCPTCPIADCDSCDASVCGDHRIHLCEVMGYACAWLRGCHDDLSGMTRAAYIWRNGECYCWRGDDHNWHPADCTTDGSGCCYDGSAVSAAQDLGGGVISTQRVPHRTPGQPILRRVQVDLDVSPAASAMALMVNVPQGWDVADITDGGQWDAEARKVKWGPFFDDLSRTVGFQAIEAAKGVPDRGSTARLPRWSGVVSIDGVNSRLRTK